MRVARGLVNPLDRALSTYSSEAVHVARGTSYFIIQNVVTSAAMVVSFAILARLLSPQEMGIFAVLLLVNGACQIVGTLALPQAVTRFVAENLAKGRARMASGVFFQAVRSTLLLSLPLALSVFFAATTLATSLVGQQDAAILFRFLSLEILLYTGLLPVLTASMLGFQRFRDAALVGIANTLVRQSLIIFAVLLLQNFLGLVIAWVIADAIAATIYLVYIIRLLRPLHFGFPLKDMLKFSWPLWVSSNVGFAAQWFDRAILLVLVPLATLGVYNVTITALAEVSEMQPQYSSQQDIRTLCLVLFSILLQRCLWLSSFKLEHPYQKFNREHTRPESSS